jgi:hypothetical protein
MFGHYRQPKPLSENREAQKQKLEIIELKEAIGMFEIGFSFGVPNPLPSLLRKY